MRQAVEDGFLTEAELREALKQILPEAGTLSLPLIGLLIAAKISNGNIKKEEYFTAIKPLRRMKSKRRRAVKCTG